MFVWFNRPLFFEVKKLQITNCKRMYRHQKGNLTIKIVISIVALFIVILSAAEVVAANGALTVSEATGKKGDTVEIVVDIQGIASLEGIEGISGGELVLVYDSKLADVKKADPGKAISGFMFIRNLRLTENSIKVVWASGSSLTSEDGEICRVTFTMKKNGILRPTIESPLLFDQDVRSLQVAAAGLSTGEGNPLQGSEQESDDKGTGDDDPSGGEKGSSGKGTAERGVTRYTVAPPLETAPDSATTGGQESSPDPAKEEVKSADESDGEHAGPNSGPPGDNRKPGLTAWLWIICGGVIVLASVVYLLSGKYKQKKRSKHS